MELLEVDELGAAESLVAFGDLRRARDRAERDIFVLAAHFADLYNVDSEAKNVRTLPGTERPIQVAGDGAPLVLEFAIAELGVELGTTSHSAKRLIGDALETRHRLPRLWRRVYECEVPAWKARKVAQAARGLTVAQAAAVDDEVADYADDRLAYRQFVGSLEAAVIAADPDAAAAREREAAREEFAKVGRSNEHGRKTLYVKTSTEQMVRIDATIAYLADALRAFGDTDNEDRRRAKAMLLLANPAEALGLMQSLATARARAGECSPGYDDHDAPVPDDSSLPDDARADSRLPDDAEPADARANGASGSNCAGAAGPVSNAQSDGAPAVADELDRLKKPFRPANVPRCSCRGGTFTFDRRSLLPRVNLYLHLTDATLDNRGNGVARWEGEGPVTAAYVRDFLGPNCQFVVKPVIDLANQSPAAGYEIPAHLREAVHLRSPVDIFPYASHDTRRKQLDHTVPYVHSEAGTPSETQTSMENLGPMNGFHHRVKTHGRWQLAQPFAGVYLWKSPHGSVFLVDNTGTRQVRHPQVTTPTARQGAPGGSLDDPPGDPASTSSSRQVNENSPMVDHFWSVLNIAV